MTTQNTFLVSDTVHCSNVLYKWYGVCGVNTIAIFIIALRLMRRISLQGGKPGFVAMGYKC